MFTVKEFFYDPELFQTLKITKKRKRLFHQEPQIIQKEIAEEDEILPKPKHKIRKQVNELPIEQIEYQEINIIDYADIQEKYDFSSCTITNSVLEGTIIPEKNCFKIIKFIYQFIDDIDVIKSITLLNIIDGKHYEKGYEPVEVDGEMISVQGVPKNKSFKEIFNLVTENALEFTIDVILKTNEHLRFTNYKLNYVSGYLHPLQSCLITLRLTQIIFTIFIRDSRNR